MVARRPEKQATRKLVDRLVVRLSDPLSLDEPFVHENRVPQTRSRHVLVVWDAWRKLDNETRSTMIMDAYDAAGVLKGDAVRIALGLTQDEAFDLGYLPFRIVSTRRKGDPVPIDKLQKAFDSVGGVHIRTGSERQLRFPSLEYAQEAYRQLSEKIPGPYWAIVQEVVPAN